MACSAITHTSDANSEGTESSQSQQVKCKLILFSPKGRIGLVDCRIDWPKKT